MLSHVIVTPNPLLKKDVQTPRTRDLLPFASRKISISRSWNDIVDGSIRIWFGGPSRMDERGSI